LNAGTLVAEKQNPNEPLEPWELRDFIRTTTNFRAELEKEQVRFHEAIESIPAIKRETDRQSAALFAENEKDSGTGIQGLVPLAREVVILVKWAQRLTPWIGGALLGIAFMLAVVIGMLYKMAAGGFKGLGIFG
jgi:hypothetical protein